MNLPDLLGKTVNFDIGSYKFAPNYLQAGSIVVLSFLLILTVAQLRQKFVQWSVKGSLTGIFFGFLLALIFEGFLIIGGKTAVTEILGWKNAPKPVTVALDKGKDKLVDVLGVSDEIPNSMASSDPTADDAIVILQSLDPTEIKKVKALICNP